jgi:hypothetical protein
MGVFQVRQAQSSAYFLGMVRVFEQAFLFSTRGRAILQRSRAKTLPNVLF